MKFRTQRCLLGICYMYFWVIQLMAIKQFHFGHWIKCSNYDYDVDFYIFDWKITVSKKDCMDACKSTNACEYVNYEVRVHLCALIKVKDGKEGQLPMVEKKPGYIYMKKTEWNAKEDSSVSDVGTFYFADRSTHYGCGIPQNGDFQGNMLTAGDKILLKCSKPGYTSLQESFEFVSSTCAEDGTWPNPFACQSYFKGSYYYIEETARNWTDAEMNCKSISGHLVGLNSEEEYQFIIDMMGFTSDGLRVYWTGGNDLETEGNYVWPDGTPFSDFDIWRETQPDNYMDEEHCAEIEEKSQKLNDKRCSTEQHSICEIP